MKNTGFVRLGLVTALVAAGAASSSMASGVGAEALSGGPAGHDGAEWRTCGRILSEAPEPVLRRLLSGEAGSEQVGDRGLSREDEERILNCLEWVEVQAQRQPGMEGFVTGAFDRDGGQISSVPCKDRFHDNCTLYVSCRLQEAGFRPWGFDASTYEAKATLISQGPSYLPTYGDVAIFNTGSQWGHMAFVEWRSPWTGEIWISETNWGGVGFQWRSLGGGGPQVPYLAGYHRPPRQ